MLELLTPGQMARADEAAWAAGVSSQTLMENAGQAVAYEIVQRFAFQPVLVIVGPGNNGGDGYVVARLLADRGWPVRVMALDGALPRSADAAIAARQWTGPVETADPGALNGAGIIVDALFGAGLKGDVSGEAAALIDAVNGSDAQVVSIDVPSGLDGASGQARGSTIAADLTVTFFRLKPGHLLEPGRSLCGMLELADIGIPETVLSGLGPTPFQNAPGLWRLPRRQAGGHKYDAGHCVVVSAGRFKTGAARLAARAALRIGAGLVTLVGSSDALAEHAAHVTAIMLAEAEGADALAAVLSDRRRNAVVIGPGMPPGDKTAALVATTLQERRGVVLDAGALTSFADGPETLFAAIGPHQGDVVLTPHDGEFARLFGTIDGSKVARAQEAARRSGAIVVLKGSDTVVAAPDGRTRINAASSPYLATAGTGDVLAGMIGGLLAQGMGGFDAASAAVHVHGLAGERCGGPGFVSDDLPDCLPQILADMPHPVLSPGAARRERLGL